MPSILENIVEHKRLEIAAAKRERPVAELMERMERAGAPRDFLAALLAAHPIGLIAEIKRASPSQGTIRADVDPIAVGQSYQTAGAHCLSVLTDQKFFGGTLEDLMAVRASVSIPVLRKDFIVDTYQVYEARAAGADAVLLIAECLDDPTMADLHRLIIELGMTPLVELYRQENVARVLRLNPRLVGVNNRDLHTFHVDLSRTGQVREIVPSSIPLVSESGIATRNDAERLVALGVQAMLVGQSLMQSADIASAVRALLPNGSR